MRTNGGSTIVRRDLEFALYDALPPAVRQELQQAPTQLGALSARRLVAECDTRKMNAAVVLRHCVREQTLSETMRKWGDDHPQATKECLWSYQLHPLGRRRRS